jgi:hypothetical protein
MEAVMNKSYFTIHNIRFSGFILLIILFFMLSSCTLKCGVIEAIFKLSPESRLPRWADFSGYQRKDLTMEIICCVVPLGSRAEVVVYGPPPERKILFEKAGKMRWHPLSTSRYNKYPNTKVPNYSIITVNGIDEVFEQRREDNILYIIDDPNHRGTPLKY